VGYFTVMKCKLNVKGLGDGRFGNNPLGCMTR
jgi:hypothetical protein